MTGRLIGEAYISLLADADMFGPDADSKVKAALKGVKGVVPIDGDTAQLDRKVIAAAARMKAMKATVPISGDTRGLIKDISGLYVALDALREKAGDIPLDLENNGAMRSITGVIGGIDALMAKIEKVEEKGLDFNLYKAISEFYRLNGIIDDTAIKAENMKADFEDVNALAKLGSLGGAVEKLSEQLANLRANVGTLAEESAVARMQAQAYKLAKTLAGMTASVDTLPFEADLLALAAKAEAFEHRHVVVPVELGSPIPAGYTGAGLGQSPGYLNAAATLSTIGLDAAKTAAVWERLNRDFADTSGVTGLVTAGLEKIARGQGMIIGGATGWAAWTNKIRLFGGALDSVLPAWARAISMWHLGLDLLFEFAAAWTPAIIAVGTFAAYAAPVAEKIFGQWKNINTVLDGVGGNLKDLGTSFDTVERAIEPSILAAFGEYMMVIGKNAGPMAEALKGVGNVVDDWGAALVNWASKATKSFDNVLHSGTSDFALIGAGFKSLFQIIGDLIHDMPGIVHVLLPVGDAFLAVVANVVKFSGGLISAGLLIHGVMVYAGLAMTAVVALGRAMVTAFAINFTKRTGIALMGEEATVASGKFSKFGAAIGATAGNIVGGTTAIVKWVKATGNMVGDVGFGAMAVSKLSKGFAMLPGVTALAEGGFKVFGTVMSGTAVAAAAGAGAIGLGLVGALVYFAIKAYNAQSAAMKLNAELNKLIADSTAANFSQNLTIAFSKTATAIQGNEADLKSLTGTTQVTSKTLTQMGPALANPVFGFSALGEKVNAANANLSENKATLLQVAGYAENYGARMNALAGIFGSTGAAQSALNLKGITAGQIAKESNSQFATQETILQGLAAGYGYMGQNVGAAAGQLNTLNISTGTTFKNVQALQQAESQWVSTITGGENAFTTFEQGQNTLGGTLSTTGKSAATLSVHLGNLTQTYANVGAKMSGTSAASLAARQAFDQQLSAATTLWGNLQMLSTASGNTAKSQASLGKAGKDIIAQLLPFAAGSKQATAEVSSLAQVMGGPATDNFQTLAKWVGHTKGAEADLNSQQAILTISASNLSAAAKNLGNALETNLSQAEAAAIAKTFGLNQAIAGLASNVQKSGHQVNTAAVSMAGEYVSALTKSGMSTKDATSQLNAYLQRLGYTPSQIKAIDSQLGDSAGQWNKYEAAVKNNVQSAKNFQAATAANGTVIKNMGIAMGLGSVASDALWHAIVKQDASLVSNGNHANAAKAIFASFAENGLGLTAAQAGDLWQKFGHQNLDTLASKAASTKSSFIDFATRGLHLTSTDADILWKAFATQNLDMLVSKGNSAKNKFIDLAMNGLDLTKSKAQDLWNTLQHQYLDTLANKAGETKQSFEKVASQFGLTKAQADNLWSSLKKLAGGSPYGVTVNETLTGKGRLTAAVSGTAVTIASTSAGAASNANIINASNAVTKAAAGIGHHAAGWMVPPGGSPSGQDGHLAVLAPGELVIPTSHAPAHAALAKQHGIPGMASGGWAPGVANIVGSATQGVPTMAKGALQATDNAISQWVNNINNQFSMLGFSGPLGGATGSEMSNGREMFQYFRQYAHMTPIAAAGAIASIWGESTWNPFAIGTGGRGLIGWTPVGKISDATFSGGMRTQLPAILQYLSMNGYWGYVDEMNKASSVLEAANIWGKDVERYGINDVHPTGIALATSIMNSGGMSTAAAVNGAQGLANAIGKTSQTKTHSAGGMVSEPVYGTGAWSGMPYSFAENGRPEYVGPLSGQQATGGQMQPMTNIQGQQANNQLATISKLLQQLPTVLAKALAVGGGNGVRHGYYRAQN